MTITRRHLIQSAGATVLLAGIGRSALAQALETARIVVGFPPGSTPDALARRVAEKLVSLGYARAALVDNRPGAGGQIAVSNVKGAAPDGASILLTPMAILGVYPHTYKKLPYDPVADLTPVSMGATFDVGFAVGPAVPESVRTIPEFMAWCKANPAKASFGSPAPGSPLHFTGIMLGRAAGVELTHIGFRGTQAAIPDLLSGQLPALCGPLGEFLRHLPGGKVRVLGTSGAQRSRFTPNVATFVEQGFKDMALSEWHGFFLPAKASPEVVQKLNTVLRQALTAPDMVEGLAVFGLDPAPSTPAELASKLKADTERWGPIVKAIGFMAD